MQRTIVALCGARDVGKTTTIRLVYEKLAQEGKLIDPGRRSRSEIKSAILEIGGVKIGFASQGDVDEILEENLEPLFEAGCSVIVCATHTSRSRTYSVVKQLERDYK